MSDFGKNVKVHVDPWTARSLLFAPGPGRDRQPCLLAERGGAGAARGGGVPELHRARTGAVALDGEMMDLAVVERARQVLAEAERNTLDGN
jgi:hypothetical protein